MRHKVSLIQLHRKVPEPAGLDPMRTNLSTVLDPTRRSIDAREFDTALRRKIGSAKTRPSRKLRRFTRASGWSESTRTARWQSAFLGPTGSGKTRVVEAMAESLFGDARACIKIDCAEFQHSHEIAKLIGLSGILRPPGNAPPVDPEALNQWHAEKLKLILPFDEIEKASTRSGSCCGHPRDKATLTLGDNRRVDLSQCIIIMTSNLVPGR